MEDTVYRLRTQIYKVTANISGEMNNPLVEILHRRQILSDSFYNIRRFLDNQVGIVVPQNIDNILNASAGDLDEIIRKLVKIKVIKSKDCKYYLMNHMNVIRSSEEI